MTTDTKDPGFIAKKEDLKKLLIRIRDEEGHKSVQDLRDEFKQELSQATPMMIALAEQELVDQAGFSRDDLLNACDIHLELFKEAVNQPALVTDPGHPIARFQQDHQVILEIMYRLRDNIRLAVQKQSWAEAAGVMPDILRDVDLLLESENHNIRQENTLFPLLERHGLEQPPAIMWMEHTEMKQKKKQLKSLLEDYTNKDFLLIISQAEGIITLLIEDFANHTQKEQNILYLTALDVLSQEEWNDIREECDSLGYFTDHMK